MSVMVLCLLLAAPGTSRSDVSELLAKSKVCYDEADFACAESELSNARRLIEERDDVPVADRIEIFELSAATALALDQPGAAEEHTKAILRLQPNHVPQGWNPSWMAVFERVRAQLPDTSPPELTVITPAGARAGEPLTFVIETKDVRRVDRVRLSVQGVEGVVRLSATSQDRLRWTATIPATHAEAPGLKVWVDAWDEAGNQAQWGTSAAPNEVTISPNWAEASKEEPQSIASAWWFWTLIGAAVAGTAVAVTVAVRDSPEPGGAVGGWTF